VCCVLCGACCVLCVVCCVLWVVLCVVSCVLCCELCVVSCVLWVVCCVLCVVCCVFCVVSCVLCVVCICVSASVHRCASSYSLSFSLSSFITGQTPKLNFGEKIGRKEPGGNFFLIHFCYFHLINFFLKILSLQKRVSELQVCSLLFFFYSLSFFPPPLPPLPSLSSLSYVCACACMCVCMCVCICVQVWVWVCCV